MYIANTREDGRAGPVTKHTKEWPWIPRCEIPMHGKQAFQLLDTISGISARHKWE